MIVSSLTVRAVQLEQLKYFSLCPNSSQTMTQEMLWNLSGFTLLYEWFYLLYADSDEHSTQSQVPDTIWV
jgi:hypothetical protein